MRAMTGSRTQFDKRPGRGAKPSASAFARALVVPDLVQVIGQRRQGRVRVVGEHAVYAQREELLVLAFRVAAVVGGGSARRPTS